MQSLYDRMELVQRLNAAFLRFTPLSNWVVVTRIRGGGGLSLLGLALATLDTQLREQVVGVGVARQVSAGLGIEQGLACGRVGDASLERQPSVQGDLSVEHADRVAELRPI